MVLNDKSDAEVIGRIHGMTDTSAEQFPVDGPYAQFQSDYDSGYATGQKERREFLARGKDEKYIRDYASGMLAGYTDVSISRMTGAPGPGRIVSLHRLTVKN